MRLRRIFAISILMSVLMGVTGCGQSEEDKLVEEFGYEKVETVKKDYSDMDIIKVTCVGDSITAGGYWQNNLMGSLDDRFEVKGFGKAGSTLLFTGCDDNGKPGAYKDQSMYELSIQSEPDIVVIMLGTNDSKDVNWSQTEETEGKLFVDNYIELVKTYQALPSEPKVFVALPPTVFSKTSEITNSTIEEDIIPAIKVVAAATGAVVIDTHSANAEYEAEYSDGVHPSTETGRKVLAETVAKAILADVEGK